MINKTIQKIKEYSEAIATIARSFATTIASVFAAITAGITGYREVKKLVKTKPETAHPQVETKTGNPRAVAPNTGQSAGPTASISTATYPESVYVMDTNTIFFGLAIGFLMLVAFIQKRKNKENGKKP